MTGSRMPVMDPMDRTRFPVDPWALREVALRSTDIGVTETLFAVGNGYMGMRGNPEEGRVAYEHGTYINGFHETFRIRHAEEAYGFATVGQTMVNVPDSKTIRLYIDDEPLLLGVADLESYERKLDFRAGELQRSLVWRTPSGKRVTIRSTRMVSFAERHLALMTYQVVLDQDAPVVLSSQLINRQDGEDEYHVQGPDSGGIGWDPRRSEAFQERVLQPELQEHDADAGTTTLGYRCANSGMTVAVGMRHRLETENDFEREDTLAEDQATAVFKIRASAGMPITLVKLVAYHSSRGVPPRELADRCTMTIQRAAEQGAPAIRETQRTYLDAFWERSDVEVCGQEATQQAVRWNLFQVAQASARAEGVGIAAKGVSGSGYAGHYFWDSEIYVLPFLSYTSPNVARNALRFRYTMLPAARRRAAELSEAGALYPWRTINGEEASAFYAAGTAQYHINADIAHALMQYFQTTGDFDFMAREGVDILVETARMWRALGFMRHGWSGGDEEFHIHGVTGPDEYTTVVNDNLFTNVMARSNLRTAALMLQTIEQQDPVSFRRAVARLAVKAEEISEWERAADLMHIPRDDRVGIHPQDSQFLQKELWDLAATPADKRPLLLYFHPLVIYRFQVLKQADVVLAEFLASAEFEAKEKLADFDYYDPLTTGDSSLSAVAQSIMAAEVGYQELAQKYFADGLYVDLADLHGNAADGVHVASAGGVWSALVCGFAGLRDDGGDLRFDPRLPELWQGIRFRLTLRGTRVRVEARPEHLEFTIEDGPATSVRVRGEVFAIAPGQTVRVPLQGQGPRLLGAPTSRDITGIRRSDGSVMTALVPASPEDYVDPDLDPS